MNSSTNGNGRPRRRKGSPLVSFRCPVELLDAVNQAIARSATTRFAEPWTLSSFIVAALEDKVKHLARSSRRASGLPESYRRDEQTHQAEGGV